MANAADYLVFDTTQVVNTYKLRTRSVSSRTVVARNIAPNYRLSVSLNTNIDAITVSPVSFTLEPNSSITITMEYDTTLLEAYPAGTIAGFLDATVSAAPIVIPEIPSSPAPTPLPEAPRQIISRVQVLPSNYTLTELNSINQFSAILYVDDIAVPATFAWSIQDDLGNAFVADQSNGSVKVVKTALNKATVAARVVSPAEYAETTGLALVAGNVPIIVKQGGPPIPTTGNLRIVIEGLRDREAGEVFISGIDQTILKTTTLSNIPAGAYTITPKIVSYGGINYNPSGGGQVYLNAGTDQEITIAYSRQEPPNTYSIQITEVVDGKGNKITPNSTLRTGRKLVVTAQTYNNGFPANLGTIRFNVNNTVEGVQEIQPSAKGEASAKFTISEPGTITVSVINDKAGSSSNILNSIRATNYSIRISAPPSLISGQCGAVTAVVLQDGVETTIPVELTISTDGQSTAAILDVNPCSVNPPEVTQTVTVEELIGGGGSGGGTPQLTFRNTGDEAIFQNNFTQEVFIDQGPNVQ